MTYRGIVLGLVELLCIGTNTAVWAEAVERPNILIVVADDLGFSDIEPFGGEITTPTLSRLASDGLRLTNFHTHALCTPTRAMLLTGINNHAAGIGTMAGEARGEQVGAPGYEAFLRKDIPTIADLLAASGYQTWMAGKWDLGGRSDDDLLPHRRGFDQSFVLVEGSADYFRSFPALAELPDVTYRLNGDVHTLPEPFYITDVYTDFALEFLNELDTERPFFGYLSYTAPHYPIQAPESYIEEYSDVYTAGYDEIRQTRFKNMIDQGVVDGAALAPTSDLWPRWSELTDTKKAFEARRMSVYAAMITAMDAQLYRVIDALDKSGQLDNTLILFLSDNGPEGGNPLDWGESYTDWAFSNFDLSLKNIGRPRSFAWTGPRWAEVSATPFNLFKGFATEGGTRVPAILHWPAGLARVGATSEFLHVLDLPATILSVATVDDPGTHTTGHGSRKLEGRALTSFLKDPDATLEDVVRVWEMFDRRAVRMGDWKMTFANEPWGKGDAWSLFNMREDPVEANDLTSQHPEITGRLLKEWEQYVADNGVILPKEGLDLRWTNMFTHFEWMPVPVSVLQGAGVEGASDQGKVSKE